MPHSNYIAYFDESGDHGLDKIDPAFPVFVLCGAIFRVVDFVGRDHPAFSAIKFKYFGHDAAVFHSRDIRKQIGPFQILSDAATRQTFMDDISQFYRTSTVTVVAAGIDKTRHKSQYRFPDNPYSLSLLFCLERLYAFLHDRNEHASGTLTCVFERRGDQEDKQLAAEFVKICAGQNQWGQLPFAAVFADKKTNMAGLQIADLAAYPIARHIMAPAAPNLAYDAIEPRFRRAPSNNRIIGYGLKVFP